ncbi:hypothetical protein OFN42_35260, partial [Escherichia coli]|nr:hypothetical protein [Escherichia coli]
KEEKTKQEKTSQTKPASNPPSAGIRVEIAPPNRPVQKKVEQPKVEEEAKSSRFIVYTMIGLLIIAFTSHFIYKQHQYTILKERIGSAS